MHLEQHGRGLRIARKTLFDLILSDVCMGGGSDYEFLEVIRADSQFRDIPFVLITSTMIGNGDHAEGMAPGAGVLPAAADRAGSPAGGASSLPGEKRTD